MPGTRWCPSEEWSTSPRRRQKATCASGSSWSPRNTKTPLSSKASRIAALTVSPEASRAGSRPVTSAPTESLSLVMVSRLMACPSLKPLSGHWFDGADHHRVGGADRDRLVHDLDRHRDHDQRIDHVQQIERIIGQAVERELVAVVYGLLQAWEERVVELLHQWHCAVDASIPALGFCCPTPGLGIGLELREGAGQSDLRHVHTPTGSFSRR